MSLRCVEALNYKWIIKKLLRKMKSAMLSWCLVTVLMSCRMLGGGGVLDTARGRGSRVTVLVHLRPRTTATCVIYNFKIIKLVLIVIYTMV